MDEPKPVTRSFYSRGDLSDKGLCIPEKKKKKNQFDSVCLPFVIQTHVTLSLSFYNSSLISLFI